MPCQEKEKGLMPSQKLKSRGVTKDRFDRRVRAIKRSGSAVNAYAVAESSLQRETAKKRSMKGRR